MYKIKEYVSKRNAFKVAKAIGAKRKSFYFCRCQWVKCTPTHSHLHSQHQHQGTQSCSKFDALELSLIRQ